MSLSAEEKQRIQKLLKDSDEQNPYAICTAALGGEQHTDKWERCVQEVKAKIAMKNKTTSLSAILDVFNSGAQGKLMFLAKAKQPEYDPDKARTSIPKGYPKERHKYADPQNLKYPIDDYDHVRAAISYFSQPDNYNRYTPAEREHIWKKILRAAEKFGIEVSDKSIPGSKKEDLDVSDDKSELTLVNKVLKEEYAKEGAEFKPVTDAEFQKAKQHIQEKHPDLYKKNPHKFHQKVVKHIHHVLRKASVDEVTVQHKIHSDTSWNPLNKGSGWSQQIPDSPKAPVSVLDKDAWDEMYRNSPFGKSPDWPTPDLPLGLWKMEGYSENKNIPAKEVKPKNPERVNDFGRMAKSNTSDPSQVQLPESNLNPVKMSDLAKRIKQYVEHG